MLRNVHTRPFNYKKHLNFYKSQTDHLFGINICTAYVFISFLHDDYVPLVMFDDVPMIGGKWQISKIMRCEWQQMRSLFFSHHQPNPFMMLALATAYPNSLLQTTSTTYDVTNIQRSI